MLFRPEGCARVLAPAPWRGTAANAGSLGPPGDTRARYGCIAPRPVSGRVPVPRPSGPRPGGPPPHRAGALRHLGLLDGLAPHIPPCGCSGTDQQQLAPRPPRLCHDLLRHLHQLPQHMRAQIRVKMTSIPVMPERSASTAILRLIPGLLPPLPRDAAQPARLGESQDELTGGTPVCSLRTRQTMDRDSIPPAHCTSMSRSCVANRRGPCAARRKSRTLAMRSRAPQTAAPPEPANSGMLPPPLSLARPRPVRQGVRCPRPCRPRWSSAR